MSDSLQPIIAFDADDTLWPNEDYFRDGEKQLIALLEPYYKGDNLLQHLYEQEIRNLHIFGYGAKGFTLSMIESLIELSEGKVTGADIQRVIDIGKSIMTYKIELLPGVKETVETLRNDFGYKLMIITKGDLFDQESKIARSGIADLFDIVEIVSEKDDATYQKLLIKHQIDPQFFWMIGNSLKSDVLPIARLGGHAVHIPYKSTWAHETVTAEHAAEHNYFELTDISGLPILLEREIQGL
ncbi:HAD family hydrolase [Parendozoicomonas haliclonae]|uniref:Haloacid dehalogenase-like hydrolase n=1 Tax=Parendozoicomonas haliclonae TaxID=1960125 RepID=A0A1X7ANS1_9GAMM|nr:HAD family hydrolase [Parendozoicomonas haliclonae]SMA49729.1 haloacid dehalogenase-like hydrolase [Parendozoicomonas haliclonae]